VIVIGGGLAGMAAAAALGETGFTVDLFEARPFLGGRAASFPLPSVDPGETPREAPRETPRETIDNCQHVLLRCCVNLLDLYERLGVRERIRFHREYFFIEPGGRLSTMLAGRLPAPLHFTGSFLGLRFLDARDKWSIARALAALARERTRRADLESITMLEWLVEKRQTARAIARFWRPVLVSAINEELDRMAAAHGFQVFWQGFLARADASGLGVPAVPLSELYASRAWERLANVRIHLRAAVGRILTEGARVAGAEVEGAARRADFYVSAVPFERLPAIAPALGMDFGAWEHSPITGIHLWFDRPVTPLPHAALLDRTIQWFFNKHQGRYLQVVVSASRSLIEMSRRQVIELACRELAEFLPQVREARLEKAHVIKESRATFSARPNLERPGAATRFANLFLAGDWTRSGWPATMEGAVRSGYLAAEAVTVAAGRARRFLLSDSP